MFIRYNPNPKRVHAIDCTVRAIAKVMDMSWYEAYIGIAIQGLIEGDMPSADHVWGKYLKEHGFSQEIVEENSVEDFARGNIGRCVLKVSEHVVAVIDHDWYDVTDCRNGVPLYAWRL